MKHLLIILTIGAIGVGLFYRSAITPAQGTQKPSAEVTDTAEDSRQSADAQETTPEEGLEQGPDQHAAEASVDNETSKNDDNSSSTEGTTGKSDSEILGNVLQRIDKTRNDAARTPANVQTEAQTEKDQASLEILEGLVRDLNQSTR